MTVDATAPQKARFGPKDPNNPKKIKRGEAIEVDFNPSTLKYTISNQVEEKNQRSGKAKQYVSQSTGKLTLELIFDTTDSGQDVRNKTEKIVALMKPDDKKAPPVMHFEWGVFIFRGIVESYQETIDFFAPAGVPLRATVSLTLSNQEDIFQLPRGDASSSTAGQLDNLDAVDVPTAPGPVSSAGSPAGSAAAVAAAAGNPAAARAIAAANAQESLRFGSGASLTVDASVQLSGPTSMVTPGLDVQVGGEAFAGLRAAGPSVTAKLEPDRLLASSTGAGLSTDVGATFGVGGSAEMTGAAGLSADVGVDASLAAGIQFDGEEQP